MALVPQKGPFGHQYQCKSPLAPLQRHMLTPIDQPPPQAKDDLPQ